MFESLSSLEGPTAYAIVAGLAALEASAFVGLFVPGELALLIGGYIAQQGHANVVIMMVLAAGGAIIGDSVGYEIGRRFGPALQRSRPGRRVGEERWRRAEEYVAAKGGRAILAGRFVGVLRALVPAVAGVTRMPYRRFLVWNALGAIVWAPGIVLAGYLAGSSYQRVEQDAGAAGLVLLAIVGTVAIVVFAARWLARHPAQVRQVVDRQAQRPWVAAFLRRYRSQLRFVVDRFRPGRAVGLVLTVQLAVLVGAGWAFGFLLRDVVGGSAIGVDRPVLQYLVFHRTAWLTTTIRAITWFGSTATLIPIVFVIGVALHRRTRSWTPLGQLALALGGAIALYDVIKVLVSRPRPGLGPIVTTATGFSFPSGHTTQTAAVAVTLAMLASSASTSWPRRVAIWTAAFSWTLLIAFSRVYLGVHWPTDVSAGAVLGALWAVLCSLVLQAVRAARSRGPQPVTDG